MKTFKDLEQFGAYVNAEYKDNQYNAPLTRKDVVLREREWLDRGEITFCKAIGRLEKALRKFQIPYEWVAESSCYMTWKYRGESDYPTIQYIAYYENNTFGFGGEEEDIIEGKLSDVIAEVVEWLNNDEGGAR